MNIKKIIYNNKIIVKNFSYLTILQLFTFVSPLITYPYLLRTVGSQLYGTIVFAQTIITYINIFINFGFNLSGTQAISINREYKPVVSEIVCSIYTAKFLFWIISFIIYFLIIGLIPINSEIKVLYYISFFLTFNDLLVPIWFYQGIEKMKYITYINVGVKSLFIILIFVFVKAPDNYILVPLFNSIGAALAGICSFIIVFKIEKVVLVRPKVMVILKYIYESFPLFITSVSQSIYININKLVVGSILGMSELAIYDFGEKITNFMKIPIQMITQATFPKITRIKSIRFVNKLMILVCSCITFLYICVYVLAPQIVLFFWGEMLPEAIVVLRIISLSSVFCSVSTFLSGNRLLAWGYRKDYMSVALFTSIVYLLVLLSLVFFKYYNLYLFAALVVFGEILSMFYSLFMNYKRKLLCEKNI